MQLKEYLKVIRKRWWLAVVVALVAAAVAYVYSLAQPKIYETDVTLVGKPAKSDTGLDNSVKSSLQRFQSTVPTANMAALINQRAKLDLSPDQILGKLKVKATPDQFTLKITVDDTDPQRAALIANTAAALVQSQNLDDQSIAPDDSKIFYDITARAYVPDKPSQPRTLLNTGAALALGLLVGLILIFVVEFFDNTIRTEEEVEQLTGLSVLGVVPAWRPSGRPANLSNNLYLGHSADASEMGVGGKGSEVGGQRPEVRK